MSEDLSGLYLLVPVEGSWNALAVEATAEVEDAIGSYLIDLGAPGLVTESLGNRLRITAHFRGTPPLESLDAFFDDLAQLFPGTPRPTVRVEPVSEIDWAESWKDHFPPLAIGKRLLIVPPWNEDAPPGRIRIVLDPGMAFGTGHHGSTLGCLVALEGRYERTPPRRVLDLGTGSGILAIAAAKLGTPEVWAVDIDPEAVAIARENARRNATDEQVRVCDSLAEVPGTFDLVLANLFAAQLRTLAPALRSRLAPAGILIGAGILAEEADGVAEVWERHGLSSVGRQLVDGWVTLVHRAG